MGVVFTHISSGHTKWLNCRDWEAVRLGRHDLCSGIALHCVLITVHLSSQTVSTVSLFPLAYHPDKTQHTTSISLSQNLHFLCPSPSILHLTKPQPSIWKFCRCLSLGLLNAAPNNGAVKTGVLTDVGIILLPSVLLLGTHAVFSFRSPLQHPITPDNLIAHTWSYCFTKTNRILIVFSLLFLFCF